MKNKRRNARKAYKECKGTFNKKGKNKCKKRAEEIKGEVKKKGRFR
jgi:hypothetical protein